MFGDKKKKSSFWHGILRISFTYHSAFDVDSILFKLL